MTDTHWVLDQARQSPGKASHSLHWALSRSRVLCRVSERIQSPKGNTGYRHDPVRSNSAAFPAFCLRVTQDKAQSGQRQLVLEGDPAQEWCDKPQRLWQFSGRGKVGYHGIKTSLDPEFCQCPQHLAPVPGCSLGSSDVSVFLQRVTQPVGLADARGAR